MLAKQAGFDIRFAKSTANTLPDSSVYLMPCIQGVSPCNRRFWLDLLGRVEQGATLYVSMSNAIISGFRETFGVEVQTRQQRGGPVKMVWSDGDTLTIPKYDGNMPALDYDLKPCGAEVLGTEADGSPLFTVMKRGEGSIYFLGTALEGGLITSTGLFDDPSADFAAIYRVVGGEALASRRVRKPHDLTHLAVSEHEIPETNNVVIVGINHSTETMESTVTLSEGARSVDVLRGDVRQEGRELLFSLEPNDAWVVELAERTQR